MSLSLDLYLFLSLSFSHRCWFIPSNSEWRNRVPSERFGISSGRRVTAGSCGKYSTVTFSELSITNVLFSSVVHIVLKQNWKTRLALAEQRESDKKLRTKIV